MKLKKRILLAPLDWGIGHATRCIPLIKALLKHDYEVILAADQRPMHLLSTEFPKLKMIRLGGYNIKYSNHLPLALSMLFQTPRLIWSIKKEYYELKKIINDYKIDFVISDNRFGLHSNKIPTVFITHQLQIRSTYFTNLIQKINYQYINKFDVCWVIDDKKINLAGNLSQPKILPNNTKYIGIQSRFQKYKTKSKYQFMAIVSGPEPQRTVLEKVLIKALKDRKEKSLILLGKPEKKYSKIKGNLTIKSHLNSDDLNLAILQSNLIISRPGYSTIMDLLKLDKKAIFIPTPGQTEQEYLGKKLMQEGICYMQNQNKFNFEKAILKSKMYSGFMDINQLNTDWTELFRIFPK